MKAILLSLLAGTSIFGTTAMAKGLICDHLESMGDGNPPLHFQYDIEFDSDTTAQVVLLGGFGSGNDGLQGDCSQFGGPFNVINLNNSYQISGTMVCENESGVQNVELDVDATQMTMNDTVVDDGPFTCIWAN